MPTLPRSLSLSDGRVALRDWRTDDAPSIEPVCGERDVCLFTTVPWEYSETAARAWIDRQRGRRADGTGVVLAVTRDGDDRAVGNVNLVGFSADRRAASLGYWLIPEARGGGLAVRAARLLSAWGFRELGLERIELAILPDNAGSHRVAARLGARNDGLRADSHQAGGQRWDMVIYTLAP